MELFTIGDSISQGFMSGAAANTHLSYSSIIANVLKIKDYQFPEWPAGGLPANIELVLRRLNKRYGSNIRGLEWATVLQTVNSVIDRSEDYYERGEGAADIPYKGGDVPYFHNVAVRGFDVGDAWMVNAKVCYEEIEKASKKSKRDNFLGMANASFYRTALNVLNPSRDPEYDSFTQLDWLKYHHEKEGVENLVLWLGANNALATVLKLKIKQTPNNSASHALPPRARCRGMESVASR